MKSLVPYLAVILALWLSACKERTASETTTCKKAAMEMYCKYADNANLTVAYLGDLSVNGKCIDALMLQADNETDWEMLKRDFGFMTYDTANFNCPNDDNPVQDARSHEQLPSPRFVAAQYSHHRWPRPNRTSAYK